MKKLAVLLMACCVAAGCATKPAPPPRVALPPAPPPGEPAGTTGLREADLRATFGMPALVRHDGAAQIWRFDAPDRKSTRLNSSHSSIPYAVLCLKKKKPN